jgi:FKBP-type peptidyl-prolyl cis-trans isomerase (trigger factor)
MSATNIQVSRDDKAWELEVKAEIPADALERYRTEALKELQKTAKLDGFRPGHAPAEQIEQLYGESAIMRLAAERAVQAELPEVMAKEGVLVISAPHVQTDAPERGKPLSFTARAPRIPEVVLGDWKKIATKHNDKKETVTVSDEEHQEALTHIRRERARIEKMEAGEEARAAAEAAKAIAESELPPLDDAFAKQVGYESAEKFNETIRDNIKYEKELRERQTRRNAILEDLVKASTIHYPAVLKEYELDDMEGRLSDDLSRMGATFEHYLAEVKKTREEVRKEWDEPADKRAKIRLILTELARAEKIEPDQAAVEHELEHAKKLYPQSTEENLRAGIVHAMRNEKVMELLENAQ